MGTMDNLFHHIKETYRRRSLYSVYEHFERLVAMIITVIISVVIVVTIVHLVQNIFTLFFIGADPLDHKVFQTIFGMIMTVLIAMEFKHSILEVWARDGSIIQVKTVVLIAIMTLARKFIIIDLKQVEPVFLGAIALAILALGVVYWLMRERDDRMLRERYRLAEEGLLSAAKEAQRPAGEIHQRKGAPAKDE